MRCLFCRHLGSQLAEMEILIDKMMQEDFVRYATADLNRPLTEGATAMDEVSIIGLGLSHGVTNFQR